LPSSEARATLTLASNSYRASPTNQLAWKSADPRGQWASLCVAAGSRRNHGGLSADVLVEFRGDVQRRVAHCGVDPSLCRRDRRRLHMDHWLVTLADAKAARIPEGARSALLMQHGTMTLRYYAPRGRDPQTPHAQDEIYVVVAGSGTFALGRDEGTLERRRFGPGDAIFAPAGWVHRFEDFTDDFATWVVFWGPKGGEDPG
jgi:mannose-6-phosphate isomerase-like protein (cupin superfamily)